MSEVKPWEILKNETVFKNEWVNIQKEAVKLSNGTVIDDYYLNVRPEVVISLPLTKEGNVIVVRQYKHGGQEIFMEFPGGVFESAKETPLEGALREMREETGYHSDEMIYLGKVFDDPTKDRNCLHLFLAKNAYRRFEPEPDITENIEIIEMPFKDIPELIKSHKMQVCGAISAYVLAALHLEMLKFE